MQALKQFLSIVHKYTPQDQLIGLSTLVAGKMRSRWFLGKFRDTLLLEQALANPKINSYIRLTPITSKPEQGRGNEADSAGSSVLWIDYDCYSSQLEGFERLSKLPKPPTLIVNSGKGLQAYWLLNGFCTDLRGIKARNKGLLKDLDPTAADSCYDLARVLRLPDTYNVKDPERPILSTILLCEPDRIYSLEDFEAAPLTEQAIRVWDQAELDEDFLDEVKGKDKKLWGRICSEETARKADVPLTDTGEIDRSRNDMAIARGLLKLGYSGGEILSVLTHPQWLSGRKYQITGRYDYVVTTTNKAVVEFESSPDRYFTTKSQFQATRMSEALTGDEDRLFLYANEQLYRYDEGWYQPNGEAWVRNKVAELLGKRWNSKAAQETVTYLIDTSRVNADQLNAHNGLINTRSGMVSIEDGSVIPHSPAYLSLHQLPVEYNPKATSPELDAFVAGILPEDAINVFWEYVGSCFLQDRYWPKAYLALVGPGNTGKSKLLEWFYLFLGGERNCSAFSLQSLADNRFTMGYLYGKIANIFSDLDETEAKSVGQIKALTGDDVVTGERKHKSPFFYRSTARLAFSANSYPSVRAPDEAFFMRSIIIPCTKRYYDRPSNGQRVADSKIVQKLSNPKVFSAGLNRAIEGLKRLEAQNGLSYSPSIEAAQNEFRITADTVAGFLGSCSYSPGYAITKAAMYQQYRLACEIANRAPFSADKFYKRAQEVAERYGLGEEYKEAEDKTRVWCYVNRKPNTQAVKELITIKYPKEDN